MKRLFCTFLLCLLALTAQAASFTASVDRSQIDAGETVELTLESDDTTLFGKPDLSPLNDLFEVYGTRQVNRLTSMSGESRATTRWIITLQPKHSGYVVIPPISLDEQQTQPITLHVLEASASDNKSKLAPVFIDASIDKEDVYVQAQAILTLRIYHSVSLYDDSSLTPLEIPNARVEPLGKPRTYEKQINGVRHGVIELRYAIFPQKSGTLNIPAQTFTATTVERKNDNDFSPFGPRPGKVARVKSSTIPLTVKAQPESYPKDAPWLPASALSIAESWSPEPETAKVGDSLTRTLMLKAEGLSSAQLPPLPATESSALKRYPDQPKLSNETSERAIIGSREEREALVAKQDGKVALPAVEVVWWNTAEDRLERTRIDARSFDVAVNNEIPADPVPEVALPVQTAPGQIVWPWQLACALLSLSTAIGFGLWWHARRQPAVLRATQTGPSPRTLLDDIKRACLANDTQASRAALDAWARQQPETLAEMAARDEPLSKALHDLNGALYGEEAQQWQGEELWQAVRNLPALTVVESTSNADNSALPALYPR